LPEHQRRRDVIVVRVGPGSDARAVAGTDPLAEQLGAALLKQQNPGVPGNPCPALLGEGVDGR